MPREPILAQPVDTFTLPAGWAAEPKWDGFRTLLAHDQEQTLLRSRHGTDLTPGFPELVAAAAALPYDIVLDGEVVIWAEGRLAFEYLNRRLNRCPATAARLAEQHPAHFVAFDLLHQASADLTVRPYAERRAALEALFADHHLGPPWTLCPMTTDVDIAREWLSWSAVGIEGAVFKRLQQPYLPGKRAGGWRKYRVRESTEAIAGAITGSLHRPSTLLLGRFDAAGRLRYAGRTTQLAAALARDVAVQLTPAGPGHPWTGRTFSAGWGTDDTLDVTLVVPELVAEISADVALDGVGRWRHPLRLLRPRSDLDPADVPPFGQGNEPAAG
ncbi:ATP-dependent DNA ligase [Streptomyces sp. NPDC050315]|uniref:ATP-dependent DNA ligase n=1 Tax=Streptomyces sp. NPDC050315 TaxID=3155039 RepID=UPI003420BE0F